MAKRRARSAPAASVLSRDVLPVSARVAWAYLASLLAMIGAGALAVLSNQSIAIVACRAAADTETGGDCKFGWAILAALVGFLLCLAPIALAVKLDWRFVAAAWGLGGLLIVVDALEQWWWWGIALLVPAVAALASADWWAQTTQHPGRRLRRYQLGFIATLDLAAAILLFWWFLNG